MIGNSNLKNQDLNETTTDLVEKPKDVINSLAVIGAPTVHDIVEAVRNVPVITEEDSNFLVEHSEHLGMVLENTFMWRTEMQKRSIINDLAFPTVHAKFHQSILEQKVMFDQAMYLAKDFENKKFEIEELECDLADLEGKDDKRSDIKRRRIYLDLNFKQYELKQMQIAMHYRMDEVKGWQRIEEELLTQMRDAGVSEFDIWHKDAAETRNMFFYTMNNLQGIAKTTDSGEYNNLVSLAVFSYQMAQQAGMLDRLKAEANDKQKDSISFVENYIKKSGL